MLNKRLVAVGLAKQTGKGAPVAQPVYWCSVTVGKPANWELEEAPIEVASDKPLWAEVDRTSVVPGIEFTGLVHARMLGLQLLAALGSIATVGTNPYTHTIVPASDVPYLTVFGRAFGGDYINTADCKVDETEITFENAGSLRIAQSFMGRTLAWGTTPFTPTTDETVGGTPFFRAAGGTFKFHASSGVAVEAPISKGSLKIARGVEPVPQAASVQPRDIAVGVADTTAGLTLIPDDLIEMRRALTGADAGTSISNVPVFGSFEWKFIIDANTELTLSSTRFSARIAMPDADPSGGALEVPVEGVVLQPAAGNGLTAVLKNAVASY